MDNISFYNRTTAITAKKAHSNPIQHVVAGAANCHE
jgi:hypothetical protein